MLTSGGLLFQNSYSHNVGFPGLAKIRALNCVCFVLLLLFFLNPDSYCKYSEKSEILHELSKETKAFSKF